MCQPSNVFSIELLQLFLHSNEWFLPFSSLEHVNSKFRTKNFLLSLYVYDVCSDSCIQFIYLLLMVIFDQQGEPQLRIWIYHNWFFF